MDTPSLSKIRNREFLTVCGLRSNCLAISDLSSPGPHCERSPAPAWRAGSCPSHPRRGNVGRSQGCTRIPICSLLAQICPSCTRRTHCSTCPWTRAWRTLLAHRHQKHPVSFRVSRSPGASRPTHRGATSASLAGPRNRGTVVHPEVELMRRMSTSWKSARAVRPAEPEVEVVTCKPPSRFNASARSSVRKRVSSQTSTRIGDGVDCGAWRTPTLRRCLTLAVGQDRSSRESRIRKL